MRRIAVTICFTLTLLCPVFCLANAGDECSEHSQPMSENCEAMTFGAVVEKVHSSIPSLHELLPSLAGFSVSDAVAGDCRDWWRFVPQNRSHAKSPPDAARRHALLQSFLF